MSDAPANVPRSAEKLSRHMCVLEGDVLRKVGEKSTAEEALENKLRSGGLFSFASNILNLTRSDKVP